jgi:hypothetical protein
MDETSDDGQDRPKHVGKLCTHNKLVISKGINTIYIQGSTLFQFLYECSFNVILSSDI